MFQAKACGSHSTSSEEYELEAKQGTISHYSRASVEVTGKIEILVCRRINSVLIRLTSVIPRDFLTRRRLDDCSDGRVDFFVSMR
jgi:hypothetical protein